MLGGLAAVARASVSAQNPELGISRCARSWNRETRLVTLEEKSERSRHEQEAMSKSLSATLKLPKSTFPYEPESARNGHEWTCAESHFVDRDL
jgi:hypothetical protein